MPGVAQPVNDRTPGADGDGAFAADAAHEYDDLQCVSMWHNNAPSQKSSGPCDCGPALDLQFERDAEALLHGVAHNMHETDDVAAGRLAVVDDEVGVMRGDDGVPDATAFQTALVDQLPGGVAGRVPEDAA